MLSLWLLSPNLSSHCLRLSASLVPAGFGTPGGLYLVPIRPPRLGACLEARDGIFLLLLGQEVKGHLQANGLHVILAQRRGHVHVQLRKRPMWWEEKAEGPAKGTVMPATLSWGLEGSHLQPSVFTQDPYLTSATVRKDGALL